VISWRSYFNSAANRKSFIITFALLAILLFGFAVFLQYNEQRTGIRIADPLHALIPSSGNSVLIFVITYLSSLAGLVLCGNDPFLFIRLFQAYIILTLMRICTLYICALEPPTGMIPLNDPFLEMSFYDGAALRRDLFFSGHTATLCLFVFLLKEKWLRTGFAIITTVVGLLLIIQRVHYTIDVAAAPFFAWLAIAAQRRLFNGKSLAHFPRAHADRERTD
jgi:hypothetical protein